MPITNNLSNKKTQKITTKKFQKIFKLKLFTQGAWNYFSSFLNRTRIIPVKFLIQNIKNAIFEHFADQGRIMTS